MFHYASKGLCKKVKRPQNDQHGGEFYNILHCFEHRIILANKPLPGRDHPMPNVNFHHNLRGLGRMAMNDQIDRAIQRSCIGRIVGALSGIFMLACLLIMIILAILANASGVLDLVPDFISTILGVLFIIGIIAVIIVAGIIGNILRQVLWQTLRTRRRL
jgi:hypothetical protein